MRPVIATLTCVTLLASLSLIEAGGLIRKEDIPKYMKQLKSNNAKDRATAAQMIGKRGERNANDVVDAVQPLLTLMRKDPDMTVRRQAVLAIGNIHPEPKETVPLLMEVVKDDKAMDVKLAGAVALGQYGSDAREAVSTLRELQGKVKDKKGADFQTIAAALKNILGKKK